MAGQLFVTNSLGGFLSSFNLSEELRKSVQPMVKFRQFSDVKDASQQGKKKGETFTWDVVSNLPRANRTLLETNTVSESNFTITQGTLTVTEAAVAVPYSGKLEDLAMLPVRQPVMTALRNDAQKHLDALAHQQFNDTLLRVVATSTSGVALTTNGTATVTNTYALTNNHVKAIVDIMKERNIPAYTGDDYYAIAWPTTYRTFKNNIETLHQYTPEGLKMIMNGEIGRYENVRYVEQTNIPKGGAANSTTFSEFTNTADAWDNLLSDWVFFFGEDTVAEAIAVPLEIRAKIPSDYGRSKGVAYYYLGGFGLVHTTASETRIVKWDSAA
jgi:N4-gp56 family major capsid protein